MATEKTETSVDAFADAFAKLAELEDGAAPTATAAALEPAPAPAPETEAPAPVEAKTDAPVEEPTSTEKEPEAETATEDPAPSDDGDEADETLTADTTDVLGKLAKLVKEHQPNERPAEPAPAAEAPPEPAPDLYSAEEKELLKTYETDWPDVARAEALKRRAEYHDVVKYVFAEIAKELSPLAEMVRSMAQQQHHTELTSVVSDYDDVRDKVVEWTKQQPAYLQPAYNRVIEQGTVEEVADLIARYRQSVEPAPVAKPAAKKEPELPTATKQAAAALAPVSSKRSAVTQIIEPNDFDSAFSSFANM